MSSRRSGSSRLPGCQAEKQQQEGQRTLRRQTADADDDCLLSVTRRRATSLSDLQSAFRIAELPCVGGS